MDIRVGVLTVSDRSYEGTREDKSGAVLKQRLIETGFTVAKTAIVPDEPDLIRNTLLAWSDDDKISLILTTGGTGFGPRDNTPEATLAVVDKVAPGISEAIRARSLQITPHGMLSRGVAGIRKETLIVNFPGSPKGALESLEVILPVLSHAIGLVIGEPDANQGHNSKVD
jgi:molybdopterin adenylyltransferase